MEIWAKVHFLILSPIDCEVWIQYYVARYDRKFMWLQNPGKFLSNNRTPLTLASFQLYAVGRIHGC